MPSYAIQLSDFMHVWDLGVWVIGCLRRHQKAMGNLTVKKVIAAVVTVSIVIFNFRETRWLVKLFQVA